MKKIVARIGGGLGNQMFQCAYGRFLADSCNSVLAIDRSPLILDYINCIFHCNFKYLRHYGLGAFPGPTGEMALSFPMQVLHLFIWLMLRVAGPRVRRRLLNLLRMEWTNIYGCLPSVTHMCGRHFGTDDITLLCSGMPLDIFLLPDRNKLRSYFSFPAIQGQDNMKLLSDIGDGDGWCSVHVRRSDYLLFGGELDMSYQRAAIAYVRAHANVGHWLFFSDDIKWCRANFADIENARFFDGDYRHPIEDLRFMTLCRSHIIANSTLSWWGAYLANEADVTVYPSSWYKPEDSHSRFPKSWVGI